MPETPTPQMVAEARVELDPHGGRVAAVRCLAELKRLCAENARLRRVVRAVGKWVKATADLPDCTADARLHAEYARYLKGARRGKGKA